MGLKKSDYQVWCEEVSIDQSNATCVLKKARSSAKAASVPRFGLRCVSADVARGIIMCRAGAQMKQVNHSATTKNVAAA